MQASGIAPSAPTASADKSALGLADDFEGFLKLLTTQLTQQDPLSPMDADKFTAQLVQFASVEQAIRSNQQLSRLIDLIESGETTAAVDYLGTQVDLEGDSFVLPETGDLALNYALPTDADALSLEVLNDRGEVVRLLDGPGNAGRHEIVWDGRDQAGNRLPAGTYGLRVSALDAYGGTHETATGFTGTVEAVERRKNGLFLIVDGSPWPLSSVRGIRRDEPVPNAT